MDLSSPVGPSGSPLEDFMSPRSKVAKMLADIDNAPTPSPPRLVASKPLNGITERGPADQLEEQSMLQRQLLSPTLRARKPAQLLMESDDSDRDVRRPLGRAARRMQSVQQDSLHSSPRASYDAQNDEEDLYSVTPMKQTEQMSSKAEFTNEGGNDIFVSPAKSIREDSDEELPINPFGSKEKLAELVAQKRAERLAGEAEMKQRKRALSSNLTEDALETGHDARADPEIEKILSDASRPARQASKKALLDMERETQRLARQQALAHQMKVKKRFTTNDLLAKFNFRRAAPTDSSSTDHPAEGDSSASSAPNSDGVEERSKELRSTPPSSPPTPLDKQRELVEKGALSMLEPMRQDSLASLAEGDDDEDLPDIEEVLRKSQMQRSTQALVVTEPQEEKGQKKGLKFARLGKKATIPQDNGSDDELEIIQQLPSYLRVFDRASGSTRLNQSIDSRAIHNLKHLSHFNTTETQPQKKGSRPSLNPKTLEGQLRRRAKEQARQQQLERIETLRAKGIDVQSVEEREQEAEAFENLLEKARQDAVSLRKAEKAALKEAGGQSAIQVSEDEDEDDDYVGSESEDENVEDDRDDEQERDDDALLDEAAEETEEDDEDADAGGGDIDLQPEKAASQDVADEMIIQPTADNLTQGEHREEDAVSGPRRPRKSHVIVDEDEMDSEHEHDTGVADETFDSADPFAAFNFGAANNIPLLSPTQAFNATMHTPTQATQEDSFDILRRIAPSTTSLAPTLPDLDSQYNEDTQASFVAGSQISESQRINLNWETQPPETPMPPALNGGPSALVETPGWEPTQDPGLPSPWRITAKAVRESTIDSIAEHDTQSTVQLRVSESPAASQPKTKRGRHGHRRVPLDDDSDDDVPPVSSVKPKTRDAFREMARRRTEALTAAERADAEKEMRQMMDEQAEESEDEYAGLGGDDFVAPETEQDREMIDSSHVDVDERALAAHFAERQRQQDEADMSKLYKDLTTGVLRRKMGANAFDLDEDEDELAARRRQMRQVEEARKRKALLKDENIATLAEGKQSRGKDAFIKAIADDDENDELLNLSEDEVESTFATHDETLQSQSQLSTARPLQETSGNKRRMADVNEVADNRPPAKHRRTEASAFRRPTSLLEVQESVSFLLEEPDASAFFGPSALELSSDSENGDEDQEPVGERVSESDDDEDLVADGARANDGGFAPNPISMEAKSMPPPRLSASQRRTVLKPAVVDRLSLKRGSSSTGSALGRTAWAAGPTTGGFKVPSLLRRATTGVSSDRGVSTPNLSRENSGVKMGGSKKSSLAYQARAEERRTIVEASTKRRAENTAKIAQLRRNSSALNRGLTGRFE